MAFLTVLYPLSIAFMLAVRIAVALIQCALLLATWPLRVLARTSCAIAAPSHARRRKQARRRR